MGSCGLFPEPDGRRQHCPAEERFEISPKPMSTGSILAEICRRFCPETVIGTGGRVGSPPKRTHAISLIRYSLNYRRLHRHDNGSGGTGRSFSFLICQQRRPGQPPGPQVIAFFCIGSKYTSLLIRARIYWRGPIALPVYSFYNLVQCAGLPFRLRGLTVDR